MMLRALLLLALAAFARAAHQSSLPAQLTLSQALDIALANSTDIRTAMAHLQQASGQYAQARAVLLPQLSVGARRSERTINLIGLGLDVASVSGKIGPFGSMDFRIFFSQDLLNLESDSV
jgi:outer membrane protein TolC